MQLKPKAASGKFQMLKTENSKSTAAVIAVSGAERLAKRQPKPTAASANSAHDSAAGAKLRSSVCHTASARPSVTITVAPMDNAFCTSSFLIACATPSTASASAAMYGAGAPCTTPNACSQQPSAGASSAVPSAVIRASVFHQLVVSAY